MYSGSGMGGPSPRGLLRRLGPQLLVTPGPLVARTALGLTRSLSVRPAVVRRGGTLVLRRGSGLVALSLLLTTLPPSIAPSTASCASGDSRGAKRGGKAKDDDDDDDMELALRRALDAALGPLGGEVTFGCLVGFASGYALKKVGKAAAFVIGITFITAQTLTSLGYVDVNWKKLERQIMGLLDKDGDYRLTQRDLDYYLGKLKEALTYQLPSTGGFAAGFAIGIYKG